MRYEYGQELNGMQYNHCIYIMILSLFSAPRMSLRLVGLRPLREPMVVEVLEGSLVSTESGSLRSLVGCLDG